MHLDPLFPDDSRPFAAPYCPNDACPTRARLCEFVCIKKGTFRRGCDSAAVQRFRCKTCGRHFSTQTFRLDYRLLKPHLTLPIFNGFVSKVTHRQAARTLRCSRKTVHARLALLAQQARDVQARVLARARTRGGLAGKFQIDELETFENSRRLQPVTMPVLIEVHTRFVVHAEAAALPARGKLGPKDLKRRQELDVLHGPRLSGSREAVKRCFQVLADAWAGCAPLVISSDRKSSYPTVAREVLKVAYSHARHSSKAPRTLFNPLFPINHTLAMLRDGVSRLVRRTWGMAKKRERLADHAWIWIAYRNYMRMRSNKARHTTSALDLGVVSEFFRPERFFGWRPLSTA